MSDLSCNPSKVVHIQKYNFDDFEKEQKPYVMLLTEVIQKFPMSHSGEFLLWTFLESLPDTWKPNKQHITNHFDISDRTYERYMSWLNAVGLIEYRQKRGSTGAFSKWTLVVLNGTKFNPDAGLRQSAKIGGVVVNRKKKLQVVQPHRSAKFGGVDAPSTGQASKGEQSFSPLRQKTVERCNDAHINTTVKNKKENNKTNRSKTTIPVFVDSLSVENQINAVCVNRAIELPNDIVKQVVYWIAGDRDSNSVIKKINTALKLIRENKWNVPKGYYPQTTKPTIEKKQETREEYESRMNRYQNENQQWKIKYGRM